MWLRLKLLFGLDFRCSPELIGRATRAIYLQHVFLLFDSQDCVLKR